MAAVVEEVLGVDRLCRASGFRECGAALVADLPEDDFFFRASGLLPRRAVLDSGCPFFLFPAELFFAEVFLFEPFLSELFSAEPFLPEAFFAEAFFEAFWPELFAAEPFLPEPPELFFAEPFLFEPFLFELLEPFFADGTRWFTVATWPALVLAAPACADAGENMPAVSHSRNAAPINRPHRASTRSRNPAHNGTRDRALPRHAASTSAEGVIVRMLQNRIRATREINRGAPHRRIV